MFTDPFVSDGHTVQRVGFEIELERRRVGDLAITSGHVVACDPLTYPESEPFDVDLPTASFPVYAVTARSRDQVTLAYMVVEFLAERATRWDVAHVLGEDALAWGEAVRGGFPTESGVACLMDVDAADVVLDGMQTHDGEEEFSRVLHRELSRNRRGKGLAVASIAFGPANLLAFEIDDGLYTTYLGRGPSGALTRLVIDMGAVDLQFTPYGLRSL